MIELNTQQIDYLKSHLEDIPMQQETLREELLDHLCCTVEKQMNTGVSFHLAAQHATQTLSEDEVQKLDAQTTFLLHSKHEIMKKVALLTLAFLLVTSSIIWALQSEPPSIPPLSGDLKITSHYGHRMNPIQKKKQMHLGVDFKAPIGTPITAPSDGIIEKAGIDGKHGIRIFLKHDGTYKTAFSHLSKLNVKAGQEVKKGDIIGYVGNTGASTAPHLHYEVWKNGKRVNPADYLP